MVSYLERGSFRTARKTAEARFDNEMFLVYVEYFERCRFIAIYGVKDYWLWFDREILWEDFIDSENVS
jgi:hypothetical protein